MRLLLLKLKTLGIGVAVTFLSVLSMQVGLFKGFEYFIEDILLTTTGILPDIVIVSIDNESISKIGQWPWPREEYAKLLVALEKYPPKVVGIDVLFSEPSRIGGEDDEVFARALRNVKFPVVLATEAGEVTPLAQFLDNSKRVVVGDVHLSVDPDGVVRRANLENSFASRLASSLQPPASSVRIAYGGKPGSVRRVSFSSVLNKEELRQSLEGKIVLIGATATNLHDEQLTPVSRGIAMPGVEIQANIVNMLLSGNSLHELPRAISIVLIFIMALLPCLLFRLFHHFVTPILTSLFVDLVALVIIVITFDNGYVVNVFYPFIASVLALVLTVVYRYLSGERSHREMRNLFGKYVSKEVLEEILRNPKEVKLGGEEREVTILFSDIRGFTTISESLSPSDLILLLNRYLTAMTDVVLKNKGVVDKYIGDAIMAYWGAPLPSQSHALDSVVTATNMIEALELVNEESAKLSMPSINIGIGLNSGKVVVGNMGSTQRFDYTVMGDSVNLASRLESLTKYYGVTIIVSEAVLAHCPAVQLQERGINVREIDKVKVKGKKQGVRIFEIVSPSKCNEFEKISNSFDLARDCYYKGDWDECIRILYDLEKRVPNDGPTRVLRERCEGFIRVPPTDWNGIYEHKSK